MATDKNQAIIDYLCTCPSIRNNPIFFNFIQAQDDNKQIVTLANDITVQKPYIDGSVLKQYTFTIIDYKSITYQAIVKQVGFVNENVEEMLDVQEILDWITTQNEAHNFPNFGSDCEIDEIIALTENPRLNGVDTSVSPALAKYSISIRVTYLDISKRLWT